MVTIAFFRSCSPPSIFFVSPASTTVDSRRGRARDRRRPASPAFGPFDEHAEIVGRACAGLAEVAILLQPASALQQFLRRGLILPEVGIRDALFYG